jgi:hypothetical protein
MPVNVLQSTRIPNLTRIQQTAESLVSGHKWTHVAFTLIIIFLFLKARKSKQYKNTVLDYNRQGRNNDTGKIKVSANDKVT